MNRTKGLALGLSLTAVLLTTACSNNGIPIVNNQDLGGLSNVQKDELQAVVKIVKDWGFLPKATKSIVWENCLVYCELRVT